MTRMTKHSIILVMVMAGLAACSPSGKKASPPAQAATAKSTLAKAADAGHTPHPIAPIVDEDLFHGWKCGGGDCSTHQAGYAWAAEHKIVNPQNCQGKSESFIEGCWAFTGAEGPFGHKEIFQDED
ncbi:MAG TPA: hypothetical protein VHX99_04080 [Rhizomicrobium sp.]|jgi:hypothetical protein|nr:hypothetical protein [Rhizomicrobium sp.]